MADQYRFDFQFDWSQAAASTEQFITQIRQRLTELGNQAKTNTGAGALSGPASGAADLSTQLQAQFREFSRQYSQFQAQVKNNILGANPIPQALAQQVEQLRQASIGSGPNSLAALAGQGVGLSSLKQSGLQRSYDRQAQLLAQGAVILEQKNRSDQEAAAAAEELSQQYRQAFLRGGITAIPTGAQASTLSGVQGETAENTQTQRELERYRAIQNAQTLSATALSDVDRQRVAVLERIAIEEQDQAKVAAAGSLLAKQVNEEQQKVVLALRKQLPGYQAPSGFQNLLAKTTGRNTDDPSQNPQLGQFLGQRLATTVGYGLAGIASFAVINQIQTAVQQTEQLQTNMVQLETVLDGVNRAGELPDFRKAIVDVSAQTGIGVGELSQLGTQFTATLRGGSVKQFQTDLAETAKLIKLTGLPAADAANQIQSLTDQFGVSSKQIGDEIVGLQQQFGGFANTGQLIQGLGQSATTFAQLGFTFKQASTIIAAGSEATGRSTAAFAESLTRILPNLSKYEEKILQVYASSPQLKQYQQQIAQGFAQGDIGTVFSRLIEDFPKMTSNMQQFVIQTIGGNRGARDLLAILGNPALVHALENPTNNAGKLDTEFSKLQKTVPQTLARMTTEIQRLGVELANSGILNVFEDLLKTLESIINPLSKILGFIDQLPGGGALLSGAILATVLGKFGLLGSVSLPGGVGGIFSGGGISAEGGLLGSPLLPAVLGIGGAQLINQIPTTPGTNAATARSTGAGLVAGAGLGFGIGSLFGGPELGGVVGAVIGGGIGYFTGANEKTPAQQRAEATAQQRRIQQAQGYKTTLGDVQNYVKGTGATGGVDLVKFSDFKQVGDAASTFPGLLNDPSIQQALDAAYKDPKAAVHLTAKQASDQIKQVIKYLGDGSNKQKDQLVADYIKVLEQNPATKDIGVAISQQSGIRAKANTAEADAQKVTQGTADFGKTAADVAKLYQAGTVGASDVVNAYQQEIQTLQTAVDAGTTDQAIIAKLADDKDQLNKFQSQLVQQALDARLKFDKLTNPNDTGVGQLTDIVATLKAHPADLGFATAANIVDQGFSALQSIIQDRMDQATTVAEKLQIAQTGIQVPEPLQFEALLVQVESYDQDYIKQVDIIANALGLQDTQVTNLIIGIAISKHETFARAVADGKKIADQGFENQRKLLEQVAGAPGVYPLDDLKRINAAQAASDAAFDALANSPAAQVAPIDTVKGKSPTAKELADEKKQQADAAIQAAKAFAQAAKDLADAQNTYLSALVERDPVATAQASIAKADSDAKLAQTQADRINAAAERVRAEHQLQDAIEAIAEAQVGLVEAMYTAAGDTIAAALTALSAAQQKLSYAQGAGAGAAQIEQLEADVVSKTAALRDAQLQEQRNTIQFQLDMGQITRGTAVAELQALLNAGNLTLQERRDIMLQIHQLQQQANSDLQFDVPADLKLPTLYEVRRSLKGGYNDIASSVSAPVDNSVHTVNVFIQGGDAKQVKAAVSAALSEEPVFGTVPKLY